MADGPANPIAKTMLRFIKNVEQGAVEGALKVFDQLHADAGEDARRLFASGVESGARMMRLLLVELIESDQKTDDDSGANPENDT